MRRAAKKEASAEVIADSAHARDRLGELVAWADEVYFAYAWASSAKGRGKHWAALDFKKIKQAVIGLHFNQTEPEALEELLNNAGAALKVIVDPVGVFHPKVIVGVKRGFGRAILGSSNLTKGGFNSNTELNVVLEGSVATEPIKELLSFVSAHWNSARASTITPQWIEDYRNDYRSRPRPPRTAPKPHGAPSLDLKRWEDLAVDWPTYLALIAAQDFRELSDPDQQLRVFDADGFSYLEEMEFAQDAFVEHGSLHVMPKDVRRHVAGFGTSSGYFGNMQGAGNFKNLVLQSPKKLRGLDRLPLRGRISAELAREVLDQLMAERGVGLGAATRLVVMKRPDVFLPLNNANSQEVARLRGKVPRTAGKYVEMLESLWAMPWWNSRTPEDPTGARVWRGRVAMLDALLYNG